MQPVRMETREPSVRRRYVKATASRLAASGLAVLALGIVSLDLHAGEERRVHVRPFMGHTAPDKVTTVDAVGIVTPGIAAEDGNSFGVSVGTDLFMPGLRWEVEYARRTADVGGDAILNAPAGTPLGADAFTLPVHAAGDVDMQSLLLNVAWHFNAAGSVSPFLHAGVGYASVDVGDLTFTSAFPPAVVPGAGNDGIVYSYGVGIAFRVTEHVALDLLYRRVEYGRVFTKPSPIAGLGKDEFDVALGELSVGARFSF